MQLPTKIFTASIDGSTYWGVVVLSLGYSWQGLDQSGHINESKLHINFLPGHLVELDVFSVPCKSVPIRGALSYTRWGQWLYEVLGDSQDMAYRAFTLAPSATLESSTTSRSRERAAVNTCWHTGLFCVAVATRSHDNCNRLLYGSWKECPLSPVENFANVIN